MDQYVPLEMYQKILYFLEPVDLLEICYSDKYFLQICSDGRFMKQYLNKKYNPKDYGVNKWDSEELKKLGFDSWIDVIEIIAKGFKSLGTSGTNQKVIISYNDTMKSIKEKLLQFTNAINMTNRRDLTIVISGVINEDLYFEIVFFDYDIRLTITTPKTMKDYDIKLDTRIKDLIYGDEIFNSLNSASATLEAYDNLYRRTVNILTS